MRSERPSQRVSERLPYLLLPLAALLAILPLLFAHGCSCGHDIGFHLQSWLEAAQQFRHGTLYPAWATTPAFNAGEPRFLFYPPLSWTLGALLTLTLPFTAVPATYTWLALTGAGLSMYAVTRRLGITPTAAFLASALYLANPYMLFTAVERTAYAELLAAAWIPWLFLALLEERPAIHRIAWPLALLWLTNAPAGVMGSYTLALVALIRLITATRHHERPMRLAATFVAGTALGLALPAFFLVAAIREQRFVQINMALVPGLSVPANFIFHPTGDPGHDHVNAQATHLSLALLAATFLLLALAWRRPAARRQPLLLLATTTALIAFLLEPLSKAVWLHLPELQFLQFPWRLLMVLAAVFALTLAFAANHVTHSPRTAAPIAFAAILALTFPLFHFYDQPCDPDETPATVTRLFHTSHGVVATDEYTPNTADNSVIRFSNPGYWLASTPSAFAPDTKPNPNANDPDHDFGLPPESETLSTPAPHHVELTTSSPRFLILNLRNFPGWQITANGTHPTLLKRDDGLIAFALPAGHSTVDIRWHTSPDRILGACISAIAALVFLLCVFRSRKIVV